MITGAAQLASLIEQIESGDRVALDTEADSLHSYREKLCLLQISVPAASGIIETNLGTARDHQSQLQPCDCIVDPLADVDLEPLRRALEAREQPDYGNTPGRHTYCAL